MSKRTSLTDNLWPNIQELIENGGKLTTGENPARPFRSVCRRRQHVGRFDAEGHTVQDCFMMFLNDNSQRVLLIKSVLKMVGRWKSIAAARQRRKVTYLD